MFRGVYHMRQHHLADLSHVLNRAKKLHVETILVTGSSLQDSGDSLKFVHENRDKLGKEWPMMYTTVGVHPCTVLEFERENTKWEDHLADLKKLVTEGLQLGVVRAFGEIGLDYDRLNYTPKDKQIYYFEKQLQLACEFNLPLFLHMRSACTDFCDILKKYKLLNKNILVHSFTGTVEELNEILQLQKEGFNVFISINGAGLRDEHSFDVLKAIPMECLMIETDSPWCEIKKTHPSYQFLTKSPNEFYPTLKHLDETPVVGKKEQGITWHDFLPLPIIKSDKLDGYKWQKWLADRGIEDYIIKSRNEPCLIGLVAEVVAKVKGLDSNEVIDKCYENSLKVFS